MKLTKKKALQITADLWGWLENNPEKTKLGWLGWKPNGGDIPHMRDGCACCEYAGRISYDDDEFEETNCKKCPLIKLWPLIENGEGYPCNEPNYGCSYYYKWDNTEVPETRKKYARIIKEGALKELSC
ncbi:MAG: hypothetical protein KAR20_00600, partial [Candidatus Heimdallarchaeota archaeon]|nr:hypothetical protein [Candidatus Heimdallarchaeota archaeon]